VAGATLRGRNAFPEMPPVAEHWSEKPGVVSSILAVDTFQKASRKVKAQRAFFSIR
jgi:hypothetical protein